MHTFPTFPFLWFALAAPLLHASEERLPVTTSEAALQDIVQPVRVTGTVTAPRTSEISASVGGLIEHYTVDAGSQVEEGDLLVRLNPELERHALERARAAQAQEQSRLADARRRLDEARRIGVDQGIAASEIDSLQSEVAITEAELQSAAAEARQQQAIVERHEVRAPFSGVVSERTAEVGEWVNPGDGLLVLVANERMWFDFQVPQRIFPRVDRNTRVTLSLDAIPEREFGGKILAIVPVKDPRARTFLLRVVAEEANGKSARVTPGMSARALLHIDSGRRSVTVPRDALLRHPDGRVTAWVVDGENETVSERVVQPGLEFDGKVEIRSGLEAGAHVVTRGNESLQEGQAISVQPRAE